MAYQVHQKGQTWIQIAFIYRRSNAGYFKTRVMSLDRFSHGVYVKDLRRQLNSTQIMLVLVLPTQTTLSVAHSTGSDWK
jgi:hypothetical protein